MIIDSLAFRADVDPENVNRPCVILEFPMATDQLVVLPLKPLFPQ